VTASSEVVAHVRQSPDGEWIVHSLEEHLRDVARLAGSFATPFGNADWAELAGRWHDLGKYKQDFQNYIRNRSGYERDEAEEGGPGKVDHTAAGAIHAVDRFGPHGRVLAYLIAGHHSGLPDWIKEEGTSGGALSERLDQRVHLEQALAGCPPPHVLEGQAPTTLPVGRRLPSTEHVHLWVRMLFSCLVDADFLDTEAFMDPSRPVERGSRHTLLSLKRRYDAFVENLQTSASDTPLNRIRRRILDECRRGASQPQGMFSLTVPTGGGKTLASLGFALDHALLQNKRRVIIAIPYTSIIEQTAEVLRSVCGDDAVVEHHSNLDPDRETQRSKLATENWDAPIIVTTNVQLFESLHAAKTSACRKLHNLVDSVVILDEAQMLPPEYLRPIISSLRGLTDCFGASVVLCTATQPALIGRIGAQEAAFDALQHVTELMSDPEALASELRRTRLELRNDLTPLEGWNDIAAEIAQHDQVLTIVNTRGDCRDLHALMPSGAVHLSALMCGEHRSEVVARIKGDLKAGRAVRVISTQLVEAGVDIDFPVVYRALAGFDSIAQAAGRCNREGLLPDGELGRVVVFSAPKGAPPGLMRKGADATRELFRVAPDIAAGMTPSAFRRYFETFYRSVNSFDAASITGLLNGPDARQFAIQFRTAARKFCLIPDAGQRSIIVWYASPRFDSRQILEDLRRFGPSRSRMRRLQRCCVTVHERVWMSLRDQGAIQEVHGPEGALGLWAQSVPGLYDPEFGLRLDGPEFRGDEFVY